MAHQKNSPAAKKKPLPPPLAFGENKHFFGPAAKKGAGGEYSSTFFLRCAKPIYQENGATAQHFTCLIIALGPDYYGSS